MRSYDYEAVTYDAAVYCVGCLPDGVTEDSEGVHPIFADSEWDCYPVCDVCHHEHDYVNLTPDGRRMLTERNEGESIRRMRQHGEDKGTLPSFAWPGGYPIYYLTKDGGILCPRCANSDDCTFAVDDPQWLLEADGIHWEGPPLYCDHCNVEIPSAYGPVDPE